ncbi:MAG: hypothetical protein JST11_06545 [Acidobacteria bacterium]|nr:hypothetical protein [Acidobacteriota bacterium]
MRISISMVRYALLGAALTAAPLWMQAQDNSRDNRKEGGRKLDRRVPRDQRDATHESAPPAAAPRVRQAQPPANQPGYPFGNQPPRPTAAPPHANGPRQFEAVRPGGQVVVTTTPAHGYVQRSIVVQNNTIIKRTYMYNGVPQARFYRPYAYRGVTLAVYTPVRYYRPAFYSYVYNPWPRPIAYGWGWNTRPWFAYYGGYFTPYPMYSSPAMWLTDYLIAATLEAAYEERMAARNDAFYGDAGSPQGAPMSPEVKQAIAGEVRRQIEQERAEQQAGYGAGPGGVFADSGSHVFVAYNALTVNSNAGDCSLREGDVLQTNGVPPEGSAAAPALVLSSRAMDCPRGSTVWVGIGDLQEMQNQMRASIDRGMYEMQSRQGQGGLPALPPGSAGTIDSPLAAQAQPDPYAGGELPGAYQQADPPQPQAASVYQPGPPTLTLGLTIEEVRAIQGEPDKIVDLGDKKMYLYKDLKITFTGGRVTDIQ